MSFAAEHICFVFHCHGCGKWLVAGYQRDMVPPKKCPLCGSDNFFQTASVDGPVMLERYLNGDRKVRRDLTEFDTGA